MPELMLLRHGKSSWEEDDLGDFERPLAPRGQRDMVAMADLIATRYPPDRILCSPSRRTRETLTPLLLRLADRPPVLMESALYGADDPYGAVIALAADDAKRLLVIGHNPAIQATAHALVGSGSRGLRDRIKEKYPTGALAVIAVAGQWADLAPGVGRITAFVRPRDLSGSGEDD